MSSNVVFVHIGQQLPDYLSIALRQTRLFNPDARIILIASAVAIINSHLNRSLKIETVPCESLETSPHHKKFLEHSNLDKDFRNGFWLYTTERFFYLEALMINMKLKDVVHLENDNMLYTEIDTLLPIFQTHYPGIGATFDAPERCVPGLVYINNVQALSLFTRFATDFAAQNSNNYNDMFLLALFKQQNNSSTIDHLPVVANSYPNPLQNQLGCKPQNINLYANHFADFKSIFDAAAIGQYLGGIDPANDINQQATYGFINETSVFNPSTYKYSWTKDHDNRKIPVAIDGEELIRINNLHIHSKNLQKFSS